MGREAVCEVRSAAGNGRARVLLETDELIVRGELQQRVPFAAVRGLDVRGDTLVLSVVDGSALELDVGAAEAERWAERIRNPPSLRKRLGLAEDAAVAFVGPAAPELREALSAATAAAPAAADAVFLAADEAPALAGVPALADELRRDAALWIVYPKGRRDIREADVLHAGRAAGLTDTRVARVSTTHTGLRFVVPRAQR